MKKLIIYMLVALVFSSCDETSGYQTINVPDKYSVSIPTFLNKTDDLNEDASLQYQNASKEFYTIVIDESIKEFNTAMVENELTDKYSMDLNGYSSVIADVFIEGLEVYNESPYGDSKIAGLSARNKEIEGEISGIDVYYHLTVLEGKESYYQVLSWSQLKNKDEYKPIMEKIGKSFIEK